MFKGIHPIKKIPLTLFVISFIPACSFLNPVIGYENAFEWHNNHFIGKTIDEYILEHEMNYKSNEIISSKNNTDVYLSTLEVFTYKDRSARKCTIEQDVNSKTNIIMSWRYVSDKSDCLRGYFFEGPW